MNLIRSLKNNQWSGVISLGLGTIIAQLINVIIQPILTRLLSPEELGIYTFIISMSTLIIPIASLKLELLIVAEKDDEIAELITDISILAVFAVSIIYLLFISIMLFWGHNSFSEIGIYSLVIPIVVLVNGIRFVFISHNNRYKKYSLISKVGILRELVRGFIQTISGIIGGGVLGQALGYGLSPLFGLRVQAKDYIDKYKNRKKIKKRDVLALISKNKKHILYLVPSQFINSLSYTLITLSVVNLSSTADAGYYSISVMVLGVPLMLISSNVSRVFLQKFGEDLRKGKSAWKIFKSVIGLLGVLSILGFLILAFIAPSLCEFIFGVGYHKAGEFISILSFMYAFRFIALSLNGTYVVFNKQHFEIISNIVMVIFGLAAYFVSLMFKFNIYQYLTFVSVTYGMIYLFVIINYGNLCKNHDKDNTLINN
ncbi:hypothetical protein CN326_18265 [Bacillus sp. AFS018417]|uniref:lipopolysaccharide biosynthesis protein n=1 Tax=Bacillus sp. AFS018417 TaxID=2033491 RepID=UPI000BF29982|nr:oligosaccharide flippase family protein [Bacillus sp. AFS018417]PEZ03463.1 hypothetical protein CN326_18265 [Bacillus sp. AFS018417]